MSEDIVTRLRAYDCGGHETADEIERLRVEVSFLMEGMELAWGLIANAAYWDKTDAVRTAEWEQAKFGWRDQHWHPALDRNKEARCG